MVVLKYGAKILRDFQTQTKKGDDEPARHYGGGERGEQGTMGKNITHHIHNIPSHITIEIRVAKSKTTNVKICYNIFLSCIRLSLCDKEHFPIKLVPRHDD